MKDIAEFLNKYVVVRRVCLIASMVLTWVGFLWAMRYAEHSTLDGLNTAAVIGAILTPLSVFTGAVIKFYNDGRNVQLIAKQTDPEVVE